MSDFASCWTTRTSETFGAGDSSPASSLSRTSRRESRSTDGSGWWRTFTEAAQEAGLVVWPNAGHADGTNGDLVLVGPPFIITEEEISEAVRLFRIALDVTMRTIEDRIGGHAPA